MPDLVMVIEDEKEIRDLVRYNLERAGYRVSTASDGEAGLRDLFASRPDALVLDLMLPGQSGLEILRELRGEPLTRDIPVIVLTARGAEMDRLLGFEHGADDYLTKPFSVRELIARVKALLRRSKPERGEAVIAAGALSVDPAAREARFHDRRLDLTPREFGYNYVGETRTVDVHIRRLRQKLGEAEPLIETVTGAGYKLILPGGRAA